MKPHVIVDTEQKEVSVSWRKEHRVIGVCFDSDGTSSWFLADKEISESGELANHADCARLVTLLTELLEGEAE